MRRSKVVAHTTIKQFQQLRSLTFLRTPDPMAVESWLLRIKRIFKVLPCTDEQKVFNEEYFPETGKDQKVIEFLSLTQGKMTVVEYNAKFMELSCYAPHIVLSELCKARNFETGLRWISIAR